MQPDATTDATGRNESGNSAEVDGPRARALELLLAGSTASEVARELGVQRSTVWRWTRNPAFAAQFRATALERAQDAATRLDSAFVAAVDLLEGVIADEAHPVAIRVRAAEALLRRSTPPERGPEQADPNANLEPAERLRRLMLALAEPDIEISEALAKTGWVRNRPSDVNIDTPAGTPGRS